MKDMKRIFEILDLGCGMSVASRVTMQPRKAYCVFTLVAKQGGGVWYVCPDYVVTTKESAECHWNTQEDVHLAMDRIKDEYERSRYI